MIKSSVNCLTVFGDHLLAKLAVTLLNGVFDVIYSFLFRKHAGKGEESNLHNCINAAAHAGFFGHSITVDGVKLEILLDNFAPHA